MAWNFVPSSKQKIEDAALQLEGCCRRRGINSRLKFPLVVGEANGRQLYSKACCEADKESIVNFWTIGMFQLKFDL